MAQTLTTFIAEGKKRGLTKKQAFRIYTAIYGINNEKTFSDYPQAISDAATRGIKLNEKVGNKCSTQTGKIRAQQLSNKETLTLTTIKRMYSYLSRAATYYNPDDTKACGTISYLLWGGEPALRWSERILKQEKENK